MLSSGAEFFLESLAIVAVSVVFIGPVASVGLATLTAIAVLPRLVLSKSAGRVADSYNRSLIMRASLFVRLFAAALLLFLSAFVATGSSVFSIAILVAALLTACAAQYFNMSRTSLAQKVIPEDARPEAAAMSMFALTGIGAIASAVGPIIYSAFGPRFSVLLVLALELLALIVTVRIRDETRPRATPGLRVSRRNPARATSFPGTGPNAMSANISFRRLKKPVRIVFLAAMAYSATTGAINQALPLYILRTRDVPVSTLGLVLGAFAVGGIFGAALSARIVRRCGSQNTLLVAGVCGGFAYIASALTGQVLVLTLEMLVIGFLVTVFGSSQGPILQDFVTNDMMGRVYAKLTRLSAVALMFGLAAGLGLCVGLPAIVAVSYEDMYALTIGLGGLNWLLMCFILTCVGRETRKVRSGI